MSNFPFPRPNEASRISESAREWNEYVRLDAKFRRTFGPNAAAAAAWERGFAQGAGWAVADGVGVHDNPRPSNPYARPVVAAEEKP